MKCDFCGREVENGLTECPYCHYRFKVEPTVLSPSERDKFEGVTIDEDGAESRSEERRAENSAEYQEGGRQEAQQNVPPHFKVRTINTMGCSSGILMTLLILGGILALFFFLLPAFLVFAAIGAVVVFIIRLFA